MTFFDFDKEFVKTTCCECGCVFGIITDMHKHLKDNKSTFYCPNGHGQVYTKSTAQFLQEKLEAKQKELDREREEVLYQKQALNRYYKKLSAAKGRITKIKNRVHNGACPYCNKRFQDMKEHIKHKHANFVRGLV